MELKLAENLNKLLNADPGDGIIIDTLYAFMTGLAYSEGWNFYDKKQVATQPETPPAL